jgi:protein-L-isoaspartate(D-aspartate) O-methyltransferase
MMKTEAARQPERDLMVARQIVARGVKDPAVLAAMRRVPRHLFLPNPNAAAAYWDGPLPIGHGQTISQPYIVAFMTEALGLRGGETVLEIGTGSGYQTAVLAELARAVFSLEIVRALAERADRTLRELGYTNVHVRAGDGYRGWPEHAPFDAIVLTAAPDHVPQPLLDQLAVGGRMILPVGKFFQKLTLIRRTAKGYERATLLPVAFVPMTGEAEGK